MPDVKKIIGVAFTKMEFDELGEVSIEVTEGNINIAGSFSALDAVKVFELQVPENLQEELNGTPGKKKIVAKQQVEEPAEKEPAEATSEEDEDEEDEDKEEEKNDEDEKDNAEEEEEVASGPPQATLALAKELNSITTERSVRGAYTHLRDKGFSPEDAEATLRYFKQTKAISYILRGFDLDGLKRIVERVEVTYKQGKEAVTANAPKKRGRPRKNP